MQRHLDWPWFWKKTILLSLKCSQPWYPARQMSLVTNFKRVRKFWTETEVVAAGACLEASGLTRVDMLLLLLPNHLIGISWLLFFPHHNDLFSVFNFLNSRFRLNLVGWKGDVTWQISDDDWLRLSLRKRSISPSNILQTDHQHMISIDLTEPWPGELNDLPVHLLSLCS